MLRFQAGDQETRVRPALMDELSGLHHRAEVVLDLLASRSRQERDHVSRPGTLLGQKVAIEPSLAQLIEIGMTHTGRLDHMAAKPRFFERERTENAIGQPAQQENPERRPAPK